jgi:hypothetical protein
VECIGEARCETLDTKQSEGGGTCDANLAAGSIDRVVLSKIFLRFSENHKCINQAGMIMRGGIVIEKKRVVFGDPEDLHS